MKIGSTALTSIKIGSTDITKVIKDGVTYWETPPVIVSVEVGTIDAYSWVFTFDKDIADSMPDVSSFAIDTFTFASVTKTGTNELALVSNEAAQNGADYSASFIQDNVLQGLNHNFVESFTQVVTNNVVITVYGYTDAEIQAKITDEGYIPVANPEDLYYINTELTEGNERVFAAGTAWETAAITTLGKAGSYIQVADIDLDHATLTSLYGGTWYSSSLGWAPLGVYTTDDFTGVFDGAEKTISNMYQRRGTATFTGFFSATLNATIKNVRLLNIDVVSTKTSGAYIGGLIGITRDTSCTNVLVTGNITSNGLFVGGVTSYYTKVSSTKNWDRVAFIGNIVTNPLTGDSVGGLIGTLGNYGLKITNCYTQGSVVGYNKIGGLFGSAQYATVNGSVFAGIFDSYAACVITGTTNVGGAIGYSNLNTISNTYYDSTVSGQSDTGKGIPLTTTQLKTPLTYSQTVNSSLVYDAWSDFVWDFGTISDYPVFKQRRINYQFISDFMPVWDKSVNNPLYVPAGREHYPIGTLWYDNKYYIYGKYIRDIEGYIACLSSTDGITNGLANWTDEGNALSYNIIPEEWTFVPFFETNTVWQKDGLFYIIFGVQYTIDTVTYKAIAYGTSSAPNTPFTINPNFILNPQSNDIETTFGIKDMLLFNSPEFVRVGDTYHWYYVGEKNSNYYLIYATSPANDWLNITSQKILFHGGDFNNIVIKNCHRPGGILQTPRVYYHEGYYYMTLTIGTLEVIRNQRFIHVFKSSTPSGFSINNFQLTPIVTPDEGEDQWNELRTYCQDILKENDAYRLTPKLVDGKIRMYFAGHAMTPGYPQYLSGVPGLATLTV